jgi:hypothetical protein
MFFLNFMFFPFFFTYNLNFMGFIDLGQLLLYYYMII